MLLTLSNLSYMRTNEVPQLISQFETAFSLTLTEESKTIHNSLTSHDTQLFQAYIEPTISKLSEIISTAIQSRDWEPAPDSRPQNAKPYVYDVLLALVLVHSDVSTTASALIPASFRISSNTPVWHFCPRSRVAKLATHCLPLCKRRWTSSSWPSRSTCIRPIVQAKCKARSISR